MPHGQVRLPNPACDEAKGVVWLSHGRSGESSCAGWEVPRDARWACDGAGTTLVSIERDRPASSGAHTAPEGGRICLCNAKGERTSAAPLMNFDDQAR